jgi:hypothetical protein
VVVENGHEAQDDAGDRQCVKHRVKEFHVDPSTAPADPVQQHRWNTRKNDLKQVFGVNTREKLMNGIEAIRIPRHLKHPTQNLDSSEFNSRRRILVAKSNHNILCGNPRFCGNEE